MEAQADALVFVNGTNRPVRFLAAERGAAAVTTFDLRTILNEGPALAPGASDTVRLEDLYGYDEGDAEAWVTWKPDPGEGRSFYVPLP